MPEGFHYITEQHLGLFLLQLLLLLGIARGLGALAQRFGQPSLIGEILTGVLLGPTLLGRVSPALYAHIFPSDAVQFALLDAVAYIGLLLLLLSAGLEVDVTVAWRQRGDALKISLTDIVLPMAVAFVPALLLPDRYLPNPDRRLVFALFIATVMTISALPMTVKALHDLDLLKTDLGLLIMSALTINDIIGWAIFTLVLGLATQAGVEVGQVLAVVGATVVFAAVCITLGRRLVAAGIAAVQRRRTSDAGLVLTFVCCVGLLAGLITHWLGVHALFGLFLAGIMAGGAPALSERTRHVINQMVHAIFVPVFFATIGVQIDFLGNFDLLLVALLSVVGVAGRYFGAWVGARMTAMSPWDRVSVAIAHTPGGSMEMIMALVALQSGLITLPVFVAIVFSALLSSVILGPWLAWSIRRRGALNPFDAFLRRAMRLDLRGASRWDAIGELAASVGEQESMPEAEAIAAAVRAREETAGTAIGEEIAVPHARLAGLAHPVVAFGRSSAGLEWDAPDGVPVHLVFLILTPEGQDSAQVQILGSIARGLGDAAARQRLLAAADEREAWDALREILAPQPAAPTSRPRAVTPASA